MSAEATDASDEIKPACPGPPGIRIPGYEILEPLGIGGMGVVYKARQLGLERWVAIKLVRPSLLEDPHLRARFSEELKAAGRIRHENVVAPIQCGIIGGRPFLVMEYVRGRTLSRILRRRGRLGEREALGIAIQVARGLRAAWDQKIVHRDIKPTNILVTPEGRVKICDLGLCRIAGPAADAGDGGQVVCSPPYASPEQIRGRRTPDARTDVYSLGVTLYHMLTGVLPFDGTSPAEYFAKHLEEEPRPPGERVPEIRRPVSDLVLGMLAKPRGKRLPVPEHLTAALESLLHGAAGPPASLPTGTSILHRAGIAERQPLRFESRRVGDIRVLKLSGRLSEFLDRPLLARFERWEERKQVKGVVDCSGLGYLSGLGVSGLVATVDRFRRLGGDVKLAAVPPQGKAVLRKLGLLSLIQVLETVEQALKAFDVPASERFKDGRCATYVGTPPSRTVHAPDCSLVGYSDPVVLFASIQEAEASRFSACSACCGAGSLAG